MSNIKETKIPGLYILERPTFSDNRGFFRELYHLDELEQVIGHKFNIVQINHSNSVPNVVRGFHAEPWNKLVYCVSGEAFHAIADLRPDSPTFGLVETFTFDNEHRFALFVSRGLGNSFCAIETEEANYLYFVDDYYRGLPTPAVVWNDPDLNVNWPVKDPIVSDKDRQNPSLRQLFPKKFKS